MAGKTFFKDQSLPGAADSANAAIFAVLVQHRLQVDGQRLDDRCDVLLQLYPVL
jgi:hypothetical protein